MDKDGYLYTIGNNPAQLVFMDLVSTLPENHFKYTMKCIQRFNAISKLNHGKHRQYIIGLVLENILKDCSRYLDQKQQSYLKNVLKTILKETT